MPEQVRLKGLLVENKIFQRDIAALIGVSEKTMSDKINGNIDFKLREAQIIANKFGKRIDEIFLDTKLI